MMDREAYQVGDVVQAKFFHDVCPMCLYCFYTEYQAIRYLLIGQPLCDEFYIPPFSRGVSTSSVRASVLSFVFCTVITDVLLLRCCEVT